MNIKCICIYSKLKIIFLDIPFCPWTLGHGQQSRRNQLPAWKIQWNGGSHSGDSYVTSKDRLDGHSASAMVGFLVGK